VLEEFYDIAAAEFRTYQLDARLSQQEKQAGIFHYRWVRMPEADADERPTARE
jgi:hypothetical protein